MNKTKRKIVHLQAAMALKMTTQVRPVPLDIRKQVNARFSHIGYSMLKAAHEVSKMNMSKLARVGRALQQEAKDDGQPSFIQYGNMYEAKMVMMMAVSPVWYSVRKCGRNRVDVMTTLSFFHRQNNVNLPKLYLYAAKGPTTPQLVVGNPYE